MKNEYPDWAPSFAEAILAVMPRSESLSIGEIAKRMQRNNDGFKLKTAAINKVLSGYLSDRVEPCGKSRWKLRDDHESSASVDP